MPIKLRRPTEDLFGSKAKLEDEEKPKQTKDISPTLKPSKDQKSKRLELKKLNKETSDLKRKTSKIKKRLSLGDKVVELTKDVAKQEEEVQGKSLFSKDDISNAALGLMPVLIGGLLGGTEGAMMGVQAGAQGVKTKFAIEAEEEKAATAKALKEKELGIEAKEQESKQALREAQIKQSASQVQLNQSKAVAERFKAKASKGGLFVKDVGTARTKDDAKELKTFTANHNKASRLIKGVQELAQNIDIMDRKDIAKVQSKLSQLVGSLRIDIVGPGAFTDSEREFIKEIVGDPAKITGLESIEFAKLATLLEEKETAMIDQINLRTKEGYLGASNQQMDKRSRLDFLRQKHGQ